MSSLQPTAADRTSAPFPRWTWTAVALAAALTAGEKYWTFLHPQPWAEDASVHFLENDLHGAAAILSPYRGYLHLLPRLVAWVSARLVDVARIPLAYSCASLLIATGLYARIASARLRLPHKPWLILSFVLAASTGEVFLNITNLHWLTSFLLLVQVMIDRPSRPTGACLDLAILLVAGLTGPFVVVYLPLFVWRTFRERDLYSGTVLAVALACAGIQGYLVATTGRGYFAPAPQSHLWMLFASAGIRFAVWPFLGAAAATWLSLPAAAVVGTLLILAVMAVSLRPGPGRGMRLQVLAAFLLISAICMIRIRPDTWVAVDLEMGDSYFYIPRILLVWLVILAFDEPPKGLRIAARTLAGAALVLNLPGLIKPVPTDFEWAEACGPIREGYPVSIPIQPEGWVFVYPGRGQYLKPAEDWDHEEHNARHRWRWSAGKSTLEVANRAGQDVHLHASIVAPHPAEVWVRSGDQVLWKGRVGTTATPIDLVFPPAQGERFNLSFSTDTPGVTEALPGGSRTLAFALYDWKIVDPKEPSAARP